MIPLRIEIVQQDLIIPYLPLHHLFYLSAEVVAIFTILIIGDKILFQ